MLGNFDLDYDIKLNEYRICMLNLFSIVLIVFDCQYRWSIAYDPKLKTKPVDYVQVAIILNTFRAINTIICVGSCYCTYQMFIKMKIQKLRNSNTLLAEDWSN